jgi:hypothetical protein
VVAELDRHGHDTKKALGLLKTFQRSQGEYIQQRNLLLKRLQQDTARPELPSGPIFRPGHYPQ